MKYFLCPGCRNKQRRIKLKSSIFIQTFVCIWCSSQIFTFTLLLFIFSMGTLQFLVGFIFISALNWKLIDDCFVVTQILHNCWNIFQCWNIFRRASPAERRYRSLRTFESQHQRRFSGISGVSFIIVSDLWLQDGDNPEARIKPKPQSTSLDEGGGQEEVRLLSVFLERQKPNLNH